MSCRGYTLPQPPSARVSICLTNINLYNIETNKVKKERHPMRQDNTIYKLSIKNIFFKYRTWQVKATETNKQITHLNCNGSLIEMNNIVLHNGKQWYDKNPW